MAYNKYFFIIQEKEFDVNIYLRLKLTGVLVYTKLKCKQVIMCFEGRKVC